jgi:hypothetical protein
MERLVRVPTPEERAENNRALSKLHVGNRFRLMFGLPSLPEPHKVQQVLNDECVRCSVASLFGMQREDVPHFFQDGNGSWSGPLDEWLKTRGMKMEVWSAALTLPDEYEYYLAYGDAASIPGVGHMVVMRKGTIWHDPSGCGISRFEAWIVILPLNAQWRHPTRTK